MAKRRKNSDSPSNQGVVQNAHGIRRQSACARARDPRVHEVVAEHESEGVRLTALQRGLESEEIGEQIRHAERLERIAVAATIGSMARGWSWSYNGPPTTRTVASPASGASTPHGRGRTARGGRSVLCTAALASRGERWAPRSALARGAPGHAAHA